jgi:hypothetical protein
LSRSFSGQYRPAIDFWLRKWGQAHGRLGSFLIANQPVSFDSSQQPMPNRKMWLNCLRDDQRFVGHLENVGSIGAVTRQ